MKRLAERLEGRSFRPYHLETELEYIVSYFTNTQTPDARPLSVLLTGSGSCASDAITALAERLQQRMCASATVCAHGSLLKDREALRALDAVTHVVLVEQEGQSLLLDIDEQMAFLSRKNVSVVGYLYLSAHRA